MKILMMIQQGESVASKLIVLERPGPFRDSTTLQA